MVDEEVFAATGVVEGADVEAPLVSLELDVVKVALAELELLGGALELVDVLLEVIFPPSIVNSGLAFPLDPMRTTM